MARILTDLSFEDWVRHMFDHPVTESAWYWDMDADRADLPADLVVAYATTLFEQSGALLDAYTNAQANQGLYFLIHEGDSPLCALTDSSIAIEERVRFIHSIVALFEQCFAPRCTPHLLDVDEPGAGALNPVCYMWWDIFPLYADSEKAALREIDAACLSVMETTLQLPSIACQESALHGLGHWGLEYPERCRTVVSAFILQHPNLRAELRAYAERAKEGDVN